MALSRKDFDELKPLVAHAVEKCFGFSDSTLVKAAINCIDKGYEKRKTAEKLRSLLDDAEAGKFVEKLFDVYNDYCTMSRLDKSRKRKDDWEEMSEPRERKKKRFEEHTASAATPVPDPGNPSPGQLTNDKIKEMMQNAQRSIQERKAQLGALAGVNLPVTPLMSLNPSMTPQQQMMSDAADLQARIKMRLTSVGLGLGIPNMPMPPNVIAQKNAPTSKPTPLILDEQGRTIDATTGETIQLQQHTPTLVANIRAKKREQFKQVIQETGKAPEEISESKFFDSRVAGKAASRTKRNFKFHDPGKFEQMAQRLRTKAQLDKLQEEIAQAAKKTGIASATRLATLHPKIEMDSGSVPDMEWWDGIILQSNSYDVLKPSGSHKIEGITHLVEHPITMKPPAEPIKAVELPVMLTKLERKKMRRQNRNESQKELQEKIRLGLLPPPEPKVRMANLMRVLGTEAVQDPTKVEAHVRQQMAKRVQTHEEANAARKLTKDQRRDKKANKIKEDTSVGVQVAIYRVRSLRDPSHKFKVETNASQLFMTGIVVLHRECNVVVVEGGPKQQKKFRRLMLHRIKWDDERKTSALKNDDAYDSDEEAMRGNTCELVWEGTVQNRAFGEMRFKACPTETFAREQFKKCGVEQYWDLAYCSAVLKQAGDEAC